MAGSRRRNVILGALAAGVVCAGLAVFLQIGESPSDRREYDYLSSLSPAPDGTKALYTLLGELGMRTSRSLGSLEEVDWDGTDVLILIQPLVPITEVEADALTAWIEAGGTLLQVGRLAVGGPLAPAIRDPDDPFAYHHPAARGPEPDAEAGPGQDGTWQRERSAAGDALLRDVDVLAYRQVLTDRLVEIPVDHEEPAWRRGPHEVILGQDESVVEVTTVGQGRVVKVAPEGLFTNDSIREGQNLVLVINVIEGHGGKGRIVFDEGHRSAAPGEQPSVWDVLGPASELAFLQLVLAALAGLVAVGWRQAPALPERRERRRRVLEQVEALAGMMEQAGATRLAVRLLHRRTAHLWRAGRFVPPPGPRSASLARRQAGLMRRLDELALEAESDPRQAPRSLGRTIAIIRQLKRGERKR